MNKLSKFYWLLLLLPLFVIFQNFDYKAALDANNYVYKKVEIYIDPKFLETQSYEEIQENLQGYIEDINHILAKNTYLRLTLNPGDVRTAGFSDILSCSDNAIDEYFSIDINIFKSDVGRSYRGFTSCDGFGLNRIAIKGLMWERIYSREELDQSKLELLQPQNDDYYLHQLTTLAHEVAHVMGAGVGEYYYLGLNDESGIEPRLDINLFYEDNFYWKSRKNVQLDPLLSRGIYPSGKAILEGARFSRLTAAIFQKTLDRRGLINNYSYITDLWNLPRQPVTIRVLDRAGKPISKCPVRAVRDKAVGGQFLLDEKMTDNQGNAYFDIKTELDGTYGKRFILFKAHCEGYKPVGDAISKFDLEAKYLVQGGSIGDFHFFGKLILYAEMQPLSELAYTNLKSNYQFKIDIEPLVPSFKGRAPVLYSIDPKLPNGLSLNSKTGVIFGKPSTTAKSRVYTVTAKNSKEATKAKIIFAVVK